MDGVASPEAISGNSRVKAPEAGPHLACSQEASMARAGDGEGGTREETEDRVLEGPSLGTSGSTLSDRTGTHLFLYLASGATLNFTRVLALSTPAQRWALRVWMRKKSKDCRQGVAW